jgi:hypothetical protein
MANPSVLPINASSGMHQGGVTRQIKLAPENELRLEVGFGYHLTLKVTTATVLNLSVLFLNLRVYQDDRRNGRDIWLRAHVR